MKYVPSWVLAIVILLMSALPASALTNKMLYRTYHYGVYWPLQTISFLCAGPLMIISSVTQHFDDVLKQESDLNPATAPIKPHGLLPETEVPETEAPVPQT